MCSGWYLLIVINIKDCYFEMNFIYMWTCNCNNETDSKINSTTVIKAFEMDPRVRSTFHHYFVVLLTLFPPIQWFKCCAMNIYKIIKLHVPNWFHCVFTTVHLFMDFCYFKCVHATLWNENKLYWTEPLLRKWIFRDQFNSVLCVCVKMDIEFDWITF